MPFRAFDDSDRSVVFGNRSWVRANVLMPFRAFDDSDRCSLCNGAANEVNLFVLMPFRAFDDSDLTIWAYVKYVDNLTGLNALPGIR